VEEVRRKKKATEILGDESFFFPSKPVLILLFSDTHPIHFHCIEVTSGIK
jgi:hypothetical protein